MYYAYSPDTDYENDRTAGKSGVAHSDDALTLDQLHHEAYGKGSGGQPGARRKKRQAFGNIGNQSRLVSEVQARKRLGASHDPKRAMNSSMTTATPLSGGTVASTDASTIKMEWDDLTTDEAAAVHAHIVVVLRLLARIHPLGPHAWLSRPRTPPWTPRETPLARRTPCLRAH